MLLVSAVYSSANGCNAHRERRFKSNKALVAVRSSSLAVVTCLRLSLTLRFFPVRLIVSCSLCIDTLNATHTTGHDVAVKTVSHTVGASTYGTVDDSVSFLSYGTASCRVLCLSPRSTLAHAHRDTKPVSTSFTAVVAYCYDSMYVL